MKFLKTQYRQNLEINSLLYINIYILCYIYIQYYIAIMRRKEFYAFKKF